MHCVGILARQIEQPLRLAHVPAVQRGKSFADRGRVSRPLEVELDLHVLRVSPQPVAVEGDVALGRREPEKRLPPARGGVLADGRVARQRRQHGDSLAAGLVAIREELRERELVSDLRGRAPHQPAQAVAGLLPPFRGAAGGLVVLEREISRRTCRAEQLAVFRRSFSRVAFVDQLARVQQQGAETGAELDLPSQHGNVGMVGRHLLEPREHLSRLLHAAGAGAEAADCRERLGIVGAGPRLPVPGVADEAAEKVVRERRGRHRQDGNQRARPRHRVSQAGASEPSPPNR